jgi:nucleotide-binding universal stress UspA family protein
MTVDVRDGPAKRTPRLGDILVHVDLGSRAAQRLDLAIVLARRHGARLTALFAEGGLVGRSLVGRRNPERIAEAAREARALFEARIAEACIPGRWWQVEPGEHADVVHATVVCCRYVDLAIFGQQHGDDAPVPEGLVERVIAESGRPVLIVPSVGRFSDVGRRVLVAWTGSRESARALHDALPLLGDAGEVILLALQLPSTAKPGGLPPLDVVDHLHAHGVAATYHPTILTGGEQAADVVLNRASDEVADLTVLGAFGLGGGPQLRRAELARSILEKTTTPLLISS